MVNKAQDFVVTEAMNVAGCVSYWRVGESISIEKLTKAWVDAGLDEELLRDEPSPSTALRRAVMEQQDRHRLVRGVGKGSYAIVDETVYEQKEGELPMPPTYSTLCIVRFENSIPTIENVDGSTVQCNDIFQTVVKAYGRQSGLYDSSDITSWLVALAHKQNAVTLRDSGGVYFIPRPAMEFWNKAASVIETVSGGTHNVFRIPAMKNDEAVAAITEAISYEAAQVAKGMEDELTKEGEEALGARAIRGRQAEIETLLGKLNAYEELLGKQLEIRERVTKLQSNLTVAILQTQSEEAA